MQIHLVDGTYELFRHFFAVPLGAGAGTGRRWRPCAACSHSVRGMVDDGATHVGVATDHVIESFRNDLWPGYKTGDGIDPALWAQFPLLEEALAACGVKVWPMVEFEADDALAAAAAKAARDPARRARADLHARQGPGAVRARHARRAGRPPARTITRNEAGVVAKFGVPPASIPDYLALVGDSADGYPGLPGWGAKSAAAVLAHFGHIEAIPDDIATGGSTWPVPARWPRRCRATASWRCCSASWRRCAPTCRCSTRSTSWHGAGPRRRSRRCASVSRRRTR